MDSDELLKTVAGQDVESVKHLLDNIQETRGSEFLADTLNQREYYGKNLLEISSALGLDEILKLLIKRGGDMNSLSKSGYGALHYSACWGTQSCLEVLIENNCNIFLKTFQQESPRDIASRYKQNNCVDFLDWAEDEYNLLEEQAKLKLETINANSKKK